MTTFKVSIPVIGDQAEIGYVMRIQAAGRPQEIVGGDLLSFEVV